MATTLRFYNKKLSLRGLDYIIFWVDPGRAIRSSPYFWAELMNRSNYRNRDTKCDNSCISKDSGVVVCRNPLGNKKLDTSQLLYLSLALCNFTLLRTGLIKALRSSNTE